MKNTSLKLVPIFSHSIVIDKPLVFPLYSHDGILLANRGSKLEDIQSFNLLKHGQIYTTESELMNSLENLKVSKLSIAGASNQPYRFPHIFERIVKLEKNYIDTVKNNQQQLDQTLSTISHNLENIISDNHSGAIAKIFIHSNRYPALDYCFAMATLGYLMIEQFDWKKKEISHFMQACLCHMVSVFIQDDSHFEQDSDGFRSYDIQILNKESRKFLLKQGVKNKKILSYLEKHLSCNPLNNLPETEDDDFSHSLFNFISQFCQLVTGFNQTKWFYPENVYKIFSENNQNRYKNLFLETLISILGQYPPGSIVKLQNGEVAIVIHQSHQLDKPVVKILLNANGLSSHQMPERQTDDGNFRIRNAMYSPQLINHVDFSRLWRN